MSRKRIYDNDEHDWAVNYDGTEPRGEYFKDLDCWCCQRI